MALNLKFYKCQNVFKMLSSNENTNINIWDKFKGSKVNRF